VDLVRDKKAFTGSLYRFLAEQGHPIDHAEAVLNPTVADRELSHILDVVVGTPLQEVDQVDFDHGGRPVMYSREWHVPAIIELRVYRRGPGDFDAGGGPA
jgi:DNA-binding GntR family transcriptional regulator